jgi:ankyrin repeat protein
VDPDVRNGDGGTPLWQAASRGQDTVVRLLLKRNDVKPNIRSEEHEQTVLSLGRSQGADPSRKTYHYYYRRLPREGPFGGGETALSIASREGKEAIVRLFLERNDIDSNTIP